MAKLNAAELLKNSLTHHGCCIGPFEPVFRDKVLEIIVAVFANFSLQTEGLKCQTGSPPGKLYFTFPLVTLATRQLSGRGFITMTGAIEYFQGVYDKVSAEIIERLQEQGEIKVELNALYLFRPADEDTSKEKTA